MKNESTSPHSISLAQAVAMTTLYRSEKNVILEDRVPPDTLALSETFPREALDKLLAVERCASIRIYFGMSENLQIHSILVAADENNQDILPFEMYSSAQTGLIIEDGKRCPPECPPASVLNS